MKRLALTAGIVGLILGACASAPEPVDPPDEERDLALSLQAEVEDNELAQYATAAATAADEALTEAQVAYEAEEYDDARLGYEEAIDNYRTVLREGYPALVAARRSSATEARSAAVDVRADVATPDLFGEAESTYEQAEAAAEDGDSTEAATLFENAETQYQLAADRAAELRQQALEAVNQVEERQSELEQQRETLETETEEELSDPTTSEEE